MLNGNQARPLAASRIATKPAQSKSLLRFGDIPPVVRSQEQVLLSLSGMRIELIALGSKTSMAMDATAFAKLLHVARLNGWVPSRILVDTSTPPALEALLPRFSAYLEGVVSPKDAAGLRQALVRACATGAIAVERHLNVAASALMHLVCQGPFEVRLASADTEEGCPLKAA